MDSRRSPTSLTKSVQHKLKFSLKNFLKNSAIYSVLLALVLAFGVCNALAKQQSARLSAKVEAKKIHTTRLGNLPEGAKLSIEIESDGYVVVLLLDKDGLAAFPDAEHPTFEGKTSDRLKFSLLVPGSGDYYLLVDNREGSEARTFTLSVLASAEPDTALPENAAAKLKRAYQELDAFEAKLRTVFVFDDVNFKIGRCGSANAFSGGDTIYICVEIGRRLMEDIGDKDKARDALLFGMLHEVGHVLLEQWNYPFYDNEEVADEFATALMVMFGQAERARVQAEYFGRQSPDEELERKRDRDDRHPLSVQRARNIVNWAEDPDLLRRWQKILVPHMQTKALRALEANPKSWVDAKLVRKELASRGVE